MKVYIAFFEDMYQHSECEFDCCANTAKTILGVYSTEQAAKEAMEKHSVEVFLKIVTNPRAEYVKRVTQQYSLEVYSVL